MVMTIFSIFEWKYPFWAILTQNIKILILGWNLVPTLIWACRIQSWCPFFLFLIGNTLFGQFCSKKSKFSVEVENWEQDYFEYPEFNDAILSFCFWVEKPFWGKFGPKHKNSHFTLKCTTLIRACRIQSWCWFFLFLIGNTLFGHI